MMACSVDGCSGAMRTRSMCSTHYSRLRRSGESAVTLPVRRRGSVRAKFESLVQIETDDCVIWDGAITGAGYGNIQWGGRNCNTHRLALELRIGQPPLPNMHAAHGLCGNKLCINYRHLRWATPGENAMDKLRDGTHNRGSRNPAAKLTDDDVRAIRASGLDARTLADLYGLGVRRMRDVLNGVSYKVAAP